MTTIIVVHGLPGSGKTTISDALANRLKCSRINADQIRDSVSKDLKFSALDRKIQAYRLGCISAIALHTPISIVGGQDANHLNKIVVTDFVNPTEETRSTFRWAVRSNSSGNPIKLVEIWMNTISKEDSRFKDTSALYETPSHVDYTVTKWDKPIKLEEEVNNILSQCLGATKFV